MIPRIGRLYVRGGGGVNFWPARASSRISSARAGDTSVFQRAGTDCPLPCEDLAVLPAQLAGPADDHLRRAGEFVGVLMRLLTREQLERAGASPHLACEAREVSGDITL